VSASPSKSAPGKRAAGGVTDKTGYLFAVMGPLVAVFIARRNSFIAFQDPRIYETTVGIGYFLVLGINWQPKALLGLNARESFVIAAIISAQSI
jgi:hypothetical protein